MWSVEKIDRIRIPLISSKRTVYIRILKLDYSKTFSELDDIDARRDGFESKDELKSVIKKFYKDISDDNPVTIIHFLTEDKA